MNCPNCSAAMNDLSYMYFSLADWDMDYPSTLHEEYRCTKCFIHYTNGEWEVPVCYAPTEKQKRIINAICFTLHLSFTPVTRRDAWEFIANHIEESNYERQRIAATCATRSWQPIKEIYE